MQERRTFDVHVGTNAHMVQFRTTGPHKISMGDGWWIGEDRTTTNCTFDEAALGDRRLLEHVGRVGAEMLGQIAASHADLKISKMLVVSGWQLNVFLMPEAHPETVITAVLEALQEMFGREARRMPETRGLGAVIL